MDNYTPQMVEISEIEKIAGKDMIVSARIVGATIDTKVIVGIANQVGDRGIFFPDQCQISEEFVNSAPEYFGPIAKYMPKRRVRACSIGGSRSQGLFISLPEVEKFTGKIDFQLNVEVENFNGKILGWRYVSSSENSSSSGKTKRSSGKDFRKTSKEGFMQRMRREALYRISNVLGLENKWNRADRLEDYSFPRHQDTVAVYKAKGLEERLSDPNTNFSCTHKLHGTSHRVTRVKREATIFPGFFESLARKFSGEEQGPFRYIKDEVIHGSRNVNFGTNYDGVNAYHVGVREVAMSKYKSAFECMPVGTIVYGEIVGFEPSGKPVMPPAKFGRHLKDTLPPDVYTRLDKYFKDKSDKSLYFRYGVTSNTDADFFVYRVVKPDGKDMDGQQIAAFCAKHDLHCVPVHYRFASLAGDKVFIENCVFMNQTKDIMFDLSEFEDPVIQKASICEGLVYTIYNADGSAEFYKMKSHSFMASEAKNMDDGESDEDNVGEEETV